MNKGLHVGFAQSGLPQLVQELLYDKTLVVNGIFDTAENWAQGIPPIYDKISIVLIGRAATASANAAVYMTLNGDTTDANYKCERIYGNGGAAGADSNSNRLLTYFEGTTSPASVWGSAEVSLLNPSDSVRWKDVTQLGGNEFNGTRNITATSIFWKNTAPINAIRLHISGYPTNSFIPGSSCRIYGHRLVYPQS